MSFKMGAFFVASTDSLISTTTEVIEPSVNNNHVSNEIRLLNQEFNSFKDHDQNLFSLKVVTVKLLQMFHLINIDQQSQSLSLILL